MIESKDECEYALLLALKLVSGIVTSSGGIGRSLDKMYSVMLGTLTGSLTMN